MGLNGRAPIWRQVLDFPSPIWQQGGMAQEHPLKSFREQQSPPLSQAGLAKLLGTSRGYLNRIESGERQPSRDLLLVIKEKTGIPPRAIRPDMVDRAIEFAEEAAE